MLDYAELYMPDIQASIDVTPDIQEALNTHSLEDIIRSTPNDILRKFLELSHNHGAPLTADGAQIALEFLTCDDVLKIADGAWAVKPQFEPFAYAAMMLCTGESYE